MDYQPNDRIVENLGDNVAQQRLQETFLRAVSPQIRNWKVTDDFIWWTPGGSQIYFINLSHVEVYTNHVVFVRGAGKQVLSKIVYGTDQDAKLFADLLMGFRKKYYERREVLQARQTQEYVPQRQQIYPGEIPLIRSGEVYLLPVQINGIITLNFLLDTGASEVSIPADVVSTLYRAGTIRDADLLPGKSYRLADGSIINSDRFTLKSLKIGDNYVTNVSASIGVLPSVPILGQSFLERLGAWGIDSQRQVLTIGTREKMQP